MKVGDCLGSEHVELGRSKSAEKRELSNADFKGILDQEVADAHSATVPGDSSEVELVGNVSSVPHLWSLDSTYINGIDSTALAGTERLKTALDGVCAKLESGHTSLREIEEMVKSLSAESESLGSLVGSASTGHPLRQVGQDLSVLAYVESLKWKRGDYL